MLLLCQIFSVSSHQQQKRWVSSSLNWGKLVNEKHKPHSSWNLINFREVTFMIWRMDIFEGVHFFKSDTKRAANFKPNRAFKTLWPKESRVKILSFYYLMKNITDNLADFKITNYWKTMLMHANWQTVKN